MGARGAWLLAVAWWAGLLAGAHLPAALLLPCALPCALLGALATCVPRAGSRLLLPALCALGLARGAADEARLQAERRALAGATGFVRVLAVVAEPPRRSGDTPAADVELLAAAPRWPLHARVRLRFPAGCALEWGDTLRALVRLDTLPAARVPGGFDARAAARAVHRLAGGRAYSVAIVPDRSVRGIPRRTAMRLRRAAEQALARGLSPAAHELAQPLLFGDRDGMDPDTDSALRGSGLVHLLALSGLHVTWLAGVARALAALATGQRVLRALAGVLSAVGYALVAGPLPSLARAVAAEAVVTLARVSQRALDPLHALALAALGLLAGQPAWAHDLGFQLSCAATLGLLAAGGEAHESAARAWLGARWPPTRARFAMFARGALLAGVPPVLSGVRATLGAQLVALPLLLARFHALPWTSVAANLLAVPLSEGLLAAAGLGAITEALCPGAGGVWCSACEVLAHALHAVTRAFGAWPGALLATGDAPVPLALAIVAAAAYTWGAAGERAHAARATLARRAERSRAWSGISAALALVLALLPDERRPAPGGTWVVVLDVGQGDAIAIADARGWWLIDCGPRNARWDAGEGAVLPFLRWAGVRSLRAVALTHDDGDHTGGARAIARGVRVRSWWTSPALPGVPGPGARFGARTAARGDTLPLGPGVRVHWPPRAAAAEAALAERGDNAASLVIELERDGTRAWFTADADSVVEAALRVPHGVALLKAGHHGSGSSSGAAFVRALAPERVALSCGAHNAYGHPHAGALARLALTGAALDRTDREATLWYELRSGRLHRLDWRSGEPWRGRGPSAPACGPAGAACAR